MNYKSTYWENEGKIYNFTTALKLIFDNSEWNVTDKLFCMMCDVYEKILTNEQKLELLNKYGSWEEIND